MPTTPGTYTLKFLANNTYTLIASATITVQSSLVVTPATVGPGGTVTATAGGGPGNPMDWLALYPAGAANGAYVDWKFLNGTRVAPSVGLTAATVPFTMPTTPGTYTLKFLANNTYTLLASATITVTADTTPPTVSITAPAAGTTLSGTVSLTANAGDDIGVAGVQFKLDGATLGAEDLVAPYSVSWNTTTAVNGGHTLTAVARDGGG